MYIRNQDKAGQLRFSCSCWFMRPNDYSCENERLIIKKILMIR